GVSECALFSEAVLPLGWRSTSQEYVKVWLWLHGARLSASLTSAVSWVVSPMFIVVLLEWIAATTGAVALQVETMTVICDLLENRLFETVSSITYSPGLSARNEGVGVFASTSCALLPTGRFTITQE